MCTRLLYSGRLLLLLLSCLLLVVQAQWGMKKVKKEDGAVRPEDVQGGLSFDDMQKIAKHSGGKEELNPFDMLKAMDLDIGDLDMKSVVEEAMNSPEIQAMMDDPVLLKKALRESPLFENLPGLEKILEKPEFDDPEKLKELFQKGMDEFKEVSDTILDMVDDEGKREEVMAELLKNLDPSEQRKVKALLAGEDDAIEEAAANLAEIFAGMGNELKRSLDDPEKMENARKNFLENEEWLNTFEDPDLRAAASDPDKWKDIMRENARLMYGSADEKNDEL
ncbi:hypothetical protein NSK_000804 [Nannochloropsis salina CCMP1776]|uniref:STI1 domain-containing protein n=1 Tax=Nannochloropsis salina CCMP1776 TaxID=1027361 RepID=A0A4D9D6V7_9STRA|nr:hypothetical protein NSK_000804 [Nannochloropsis salina CCMP1776]|eukprot:TFJ87451.1 hypothetical protein NSK_000804 [Nannochloropsis salina CCMP1776]